MNKWTVEESLLWDRLLASIRALGDYSGSRDEFRRRFRRALQPFVSLSLSPNARITCQTKRPCATPKALYAQLTSINVTSPSLLFEFPRHANYNAISLIRFCKRYVVIAVICFYLFIYLFFDDEEVPSQSSTFRTLFCVLTSCNLSIITIKSILILHDTFFGIIRLFFFFFSGQLPRGAIHFHWDNTNTSSPYTGQ